MPLMERRRDSKPWGLILALIIAAVAGVISIPLQVLTFRGLNSATSEEVRRNAELVEQVRLLEEMNAANVEQHRDANDEAHIEQCRIIQDIAEAAGIGVRPCVFKRYMPATPPHPHPSPSR